MINSIVFIPITTVNTMPDINPLILSSITLALSGGALFLLKDIPLKLYHAVLYQFTSVVLVDNSDWVSDQYFTKLGAYLTQLNGGKNRISRLIGDRHVSCGFRLAIGDGYHLIKFNDKWLLIEMSAINNTQSWTRIFELTVRCFGKSNLPIKTFLASFVDEYLFDEKFIHASCRDNDTSPGQWRQQSKLPKKVIHAPALNEEEQQLINQCVEWVKSEHNYKSKGLHYKLAMLLHGVPGTGKTGLIRHIAILLQLPVYSMNLSELTDSDLFNLLATITEKSIVIFEDIDSSPATRDRDKLDKTTNVGGQRKEVTLSGLLNAFDGISALDEKLIFITTNHLGDLDPAIYRRSRVDILHELKEVNALAVEKHFTAVYPDLRLHEIAYVPLLGSEIYQIKVNAMDDINKIKHHFLSLSK